MSDRHKARDYNIQFCTVPSESKCTDCTETKNYREVCKPGWGGFTFERLIKGESAPGKQYEAHHIVCVSPATAELLGNPKVRGPVEATKWCINNGVNMMAMPVWGHTVKWYCSFNSVAGVIKAAFRQDPGEPPFKNIPAHDIDHNIEGGYTHEIRDDLKRIAKEIEKKGHQMEGQPLVTALNNLANRYEKILVSGEGARGGRKGGTHKGWELGAKEPSDPQWLHPFSMAKTPRVSDMGFPARNFDEKLAAWIDRIANAISAGV